MIKAWWSVTLPSFTLRRFRVCRPARRHTRQSGGIAPAGRHAPAFHRKRPPGYSGFRSGVGHHFLFIQALRYGKRLVSRKVQLRVRFLLQRGKVVQKRRFLAGFFPLNGFNHKLPGILYPLQGGYGFGLLFPLGGRLGGKLIPAGGRRFELPKLGGYEILVLQIAAAYHHERGCLHPAQREHPARRLRSTLGWRLSLSASPLRCGTWQRGRGYRNASRLQVIQPSRIALSVRLLIHRRTNGFRQFR